MLATQPDSRASDSRVIDELEVSTEMASRTGYKVLVGVALGAGIPLRDLRFDTIADATPTEGGVQETHQEIGLERRALLQQSVSVGLINAIFDGVVAPLRMLSCEGPLLEGFVPIGGYSQSTLK